ncbi:MAG: YfhO family protein [Planctomycetes bacterium]|nr:YfhO family protein [Planctomycetota bacterium]
MTPHAPAPQDPRLAAGSAAHPSSEPAARTTPPPSPQVPPGNGVPVARPTSPSRWESPKALALFAFLALAFHLPVLAQERFFLAADILQTEFPWRPTDSGFLPYNHWLNDGPHLFFPSQKRFVEALHAGRAPLWEPSIGCGIPNYVLELRKVILPYRFLLATGLDPLLSTALLHLLSMTLGGWCFFLLLRRAMNLPPAAALFGGALWMFNGFILVNLQLEYDPYLVLFPWLTLGLVELLARPSGPRLAGAVLASACTAMEFAQLGLYVLLASNAYALLRIAGQPSWPLRARRTGLLGLTALLGAALSALYVLPLSSFALLSQRAPRSFEEITSGRVGKFSPDNLVNLLVPNFWGSPVDSFYYYVGGHFCEICAYIGMLSQLLAGIAFAGGARERRRDEFFFGLLALLSLLMAMGTWAYFPFFALVPGGNRFTAISRVLLVFCFAVAALAAFGLDRVARAARSWSAATPPRRLADPRHSALGLLLLLLAGTSLMLLGLRALHALRHAGAEVQPGDNVYWQIPDASLALALASTGLVAILLTSRRAFLTSAALLALSAGTVFELARFGFRFQSTCSRTEVFPETPGLRLLRQDRSLFRLVSLNPPDDYEGRRGNLAVLPPNEASVFGLCDVAAKAGLLPQRFVDLVEQIEHRKRLDKQPLGNVLFPLSNADPGRYGLLNVKYFLSHPGFPPPDPLLVKVYDGELAIWKNPHCFPRAFVVHGVQWIVEGARAEIDALLDSHFDFGRAAIVSGARATDPADAAAALAVVDHRPAPGSPPLALPTPVDVVAYREGHVLLRSRLPAPGMLVFLENAFPGWEARVDGEPVQVRVADVCFIGVPLPPGPHQIALDFRPPAVRLGVALSAGTAVILLGILVAGRLRAARPPSLQDSPHGGNGAALTPMPGG